jgi:hypothetical protein
MGEDLAKQVDVRDAVSVIVPEAGLMFTATVVRGEELAKFHGVRGNNMCIPGKWYCVSMSLRGKNLDFSRAMGEYNSVREAETACKQLCRELAKRVQDAMLTTDLRQAAATERKQ